MGTKKIKKIIAVVLSLMIVISTFNVGNGSKYVVKAEESEEVTESVIDVGGDNAEISEENTEGVSTEGINSIEAGTENSIKEEAEAPVTQEDSTEDISKEESAQADADETKKADGKFQGDGYTVDFVLDSEWESGFNATVTITNISNVKIENWSLIMPLNNKFSNIWNAVVADTYDDFYVIKNAGWNQDIQANGSVSFGITSYEKFAGFPEYYTIVGKKVETNTSDYTVEYAVTDAWEDGLIGQIKITNTRDTAIEDWRLHFSYDAEIIEIWDGVIVSHENNIYEISCKNYNQNIQAGEFVTFGFKVSSGAVGEPAGMKLEEYYDVNKKYIAVMGEQIEDGILLSTVCSNKCDEYVYYISKDGKDYSELSRRQENEFLYEDKDRKEGKLYFFVVGNNKSENLKSECVIVEYSDSECVITNYDTDSDLLCDYLEYCYGTDIENEDTDGDGLSDYYEIEYTMTDPLIVDTDDNSVKDSDEDFDDDKLSNIIEFQYMTNPCSYDTDEDGFSDYYEINHNMNPLVYDAINIDSKIVSTLNDYTEVDLQVMNVDEYYPLEIEYNDELVMSISGKYSDIKVESPIEALYAIYNVKSLVGLNNPEEQLVFDKVDHFETGDSYTFLQINGEMEVLGNTVTVSVDNDFNVSSLYSILTPCSEMDNYNTDKFITKKEIERVISDNYNKYEIIECKDALYREELNDNPFPVKCLKIISHNEVHNIIIDAINGTIIEKFDDSIYAWKRGSGYDINNKKIIMPVNEINNRTYNYILEDINKKIYIYDDSYYTGLQYTSNNKDDWPDKEANSTYYNMIKVYNWWNNNFKYKGINGKGKAVKIYMHNPSVHDNAQYNWDESGERIYVYDKKKWDVFMGERLDIMGHEYAHAVVNHKTKIFIPNKIKAATINEAYADIFGSFIKGKWSTFPRNIANPDKTGDPCYINGEHYDDKFKDEHHNCTIISYAAVLMGKGVGKYPAIGFEKQSKLWYESLKEGFNGWSDFNTVRSNVIKAARNLKYSNAEINTIREAFNKVGIYSQNGDLELEVRSGKKKIKNAEISIEKYEKIKEKKTDTNGKVLFNDIETGAVNIIIKAKGFDTVYTKALIKNNKKIKKKICLLDSQSEFDWDEYDHYDFKQKYTEEILPKHIVFSDSSIKMIGYTQKAFKDFLLTKDINSGSNGKFDQKMLSFKIKRDTADWHTMEGGGFLFDSNIDSYNKLSGYCLLIKKNGLNLYELKNVDVEKFRNGESGDISKVGTLLGKYNIGNVLKEHNIRMRITNKEISIWDNGGIVVDSYKIKKIYGHEFGPITSHISHDCRQVSYFTFSDIQMTSISEK